MKKLLVLFIVSQLFSPAIAHSGKHDTGVNQTDSSSVGNQEEQSGLSQLYSEHGSGYTKVIAEILIVLGATALAVRTYFGKSEYGTLREFIGERVL